MKSALVIAAILAAGSSAGAAPSPLDVYGVPQRLVRLPDGRRLNLHCTGASRPTVLLEAGWSNSTVAWRQVQPLVARSRRVCSYDRAGLGFSDPVGGPRDTLHIVEDLEALVKAADLKPPYVLVGYSMGALSMRLFADRHRRDIAGMVLVEPSVEYQNDRFNAALPARAGAPRRVTPSEGCGTACAPPGPPLPPAVAAAQALIAEHPNYQSTMLAELVGMNGAGAEQVAKSRRSYGALPLIVLTGADSYGEPSFNPAEVDAFKAVWTTMHAEVASLSSRGVHRLVPKATHLLVFEQPQAVAKAVEEVIAVK